MKNRRQFTRDFKAKVAIEAIKGQRTANELAQEFNIHVSQINDYKKQLVDGASDMFGRGLERGDVGHEKELESLYQQIGKLQVEVEWLKKQQNCRSYGVAETHIN